MTQSPQLTAISPEKFSGKAWRRYSNYAFAAGENLILLVAAELANAVPTMPLGFVQSGEGFQLVAVTALQSGANLFVAPDGRWLGAYVPAALRGYPFRLVKLQDRADSILCIDEASGLVVEAGQGETFFDEDGRPSKALRDVLELLSQVERSRMATQAVVDALAAASLVQPWPLSMKKGEQNVPVTGLYRIDFKIMEISGGDIIVGLLLPFLPLFRPEPSLIPGHLDRRDGYQTGDSIFDPDVDFVARF